jgi:hypothetical protein
VTDEVIEKIPERSDGLDLETGDACICACVEGYARFSECVGARARVRAGMPCMVATERLKIPTGRRRIAGWRTIRDI